MSFFRYVIPNTVKSQGLMVWAAMDGKGQLKLRRCPPSMNSLGYQAVLGSALHFIKRRHTGARFQQDGAAPHTSSSTKAWLVTNGVQMFNDGNWPACSPDMNPIEHVWPMVCMFARICLQIGRQLKGRIFANREALWAAIQGAFQNVNKEQILTLYDSMPTRIAALRTAKGGYTRF